MSTAYGEPWEDAEQARRTEKGAAMTRWRVYSSVEVSFVTEVEAETREEAEEIAQGRKLAQITDPRQDKLIDEMFIPNDDPSWDNLVGETLVEPA